MTWEARLDEVLAALEREQDEDAPRTPEAVEAEALTLKFLKTPEGRADVIALARRLAGEMDRYECH